MRTTKRDESHYYVAQVCPNGHVANDAVDEYPQRNQQFCSKCGESTLTVCPGCEATIRGRYYVPRVSESYPSYCAPAYCHSCGRAFPWTERGIQAAIELAAEDANLTPEDVEEFKQSLTDAARDTARMRLGVTRLQKLLGKMVAGTANAVRDIVVNLLSETARKAIWPDRP
ncbi:MAG: DUF2321 domain-containing protein [Planctomycetota bacterium]|nr:DUF2321 domain-containing protein [Planctomycetota bacterium]